MATCGSLSEAIAERGEGFAQGLTALSLERQVFPMPPGLVPQTSGSGCEGIWAQHNNITAILE